MSMAFLTVLLDITGGKEEKKRENKRNKNEAYALPHDRRETMTIKWPAADSPHPRSPSLSHPLLFCVL